MASKAGKKELTQLGRKTAIPASPEDAALERVPNPHPDTDYAARFTAPVAIGKCLVDTVAPKWLRIGGYWYPRGGIPIDVFWQKGKLPAGVWIPDQAVMPYRGRG